MSCGKEFLGAFMFAMDRTWNRKKSRCCMASGSF